MTPNDFARVVLLAHRTPPRRPFEAAQLTGHSLNVWTRHYACSFGKEQRDEGRARTLEHAFGAVDEHDVGVDERANPDSVETEPARPDMNMP